MKIGIGIGLVTHRGSNGPLTLEAWTASIFAGGIPGVALMPLPTTCFTDSVGGTPATVGGAAGPIIVQDLSGNGKHATFANAVLATEGGRHYIDHNGTSTSGATPALGFTSDKLTVWAGLRKAADAATGMFCELSANATAGVNAGCFHITAPAAASATYGFRLVGASASTTASSVAAAPTTSVLSVALDISGALTADELKLRLNGAVSALTFTAGPTSGGNFGNHILYIGRRGGTVLPFNGRFYGLVIRGAASDAATIETGEMHMNARAGAY